MVRNLFYILLLSVTLMACTSESRPVVQAEQTWSLDVEHADTLLRHAVDSIRFLALEGGEESVLYGIDKLVMKNGLIYLADFRAGKIVAYDESGRSRFVLDAKGAGPEEYLEMRSFAADDSCIYTLDNYRHSLNVYGSRDGRYKKSLKLPFVAWDMEVLPDGCFIFAYSPGRGGRPSMNQGRYRIFITGRDLKIEKSLLPYEKKTFDFVDRKTYFSSAGQGVLFASASSDDLFVFSGKNSLRRIAVSLGNGIPDRYRQDVTRIKEGGYSYFSATPIWCKNYVACVISCGDYLMDYVYDVKAGRLSGNDFNNAYKGLLTPLGCDGERLVSYLDDYSYYQELVAHGFARAGEEVESHLKNEGAVLLFYSMR